MDTTDRRDFLKLLGAGAAALAMPSLLLAKGKKPNVIFILTDDLGWGDPRSFGHPYMKTPNLDRLANEGTRFTGFYVNSPVCSPSRAAFMTGRFPARLAIHGHFAKHEQNAARRMPDFMDPSVPTVTRMLGQAGYATGHFGKWHLGSGQGSPDPGRYGIDDHLTCNSSGPQLKDSGFFDTVDEKKTKGYFRAFSTDAMVHEAIRFITANRNRPFYVNIWTLVPHATLKPTPEELAVYKDLKANKDDFGSYMRTYTGGAKDLVSQMKVYCAAVTGMDKAIGRLLDKLDELGLAGDTLVFFASDNGPEDYHVGNAKNAGAGSPGPFRGRKRSIYEGGVRTSCIARWPGRVSAGRVDEESVMTGVDWLPTACAIAGVDASKVTCDGEDVSGMLLGRPRRRTKPIMWEWRFGVSGEPREPTYRPPALAIRDGKWKLLVNPDGSRKELYDIPADPQEREDLAGRHPEVAERLSKRVLAWRKTLPR